MNPRGEVPALCEGEVVVCNSQVIRAYLEDAGLEANTIRFSNEA